jgi:protein tyrosine phosphatase (PTP) superfamily phosphohydrolase (DUF442 family)
MTSTLFQALTGVPNACQILPNVVTGGQPHPAHLESLRSAGLGVVLDIRDRMEPRGFDEAAILEELGLEYVNIPVSAATLNDATLERVLGVLRGSKGPVFVHCASGNRVGGALIPFLMLDQHMEEEDAVAQAMRIGLRSAEYLEWGLDYARRHGAPGS